MTTMDLKNLVDDIGKRVLGHTYDCIRMRRNMAPYAKKLPNILERIKKQEIVHVCFFVTNVGMWKVDELYKLLMKDSRFNPFIVSSLIPSDSTSYKKYVQDSMRTYFREKGFEYIDSYNEKTGELLDIRSLKPDVVFYNQPYDVSYPQYKIKALWDTCIFIYVPYCYQMGADPSYYNLLLQNVSWKLFYPTMIHKKLGEKYAANKGKNIVVTGYPITDSLVSDSQPEWDGWKQKDSRIKRVIWAPHHSISNESSLHCSNFLEIADEMIQIAKDYQGKIQFAFKPHPRLIVQLQNHPSWGEEKTKEYYSHWANMPNTILAEGEYIELFKSSDALVHDCSSFMGEYLHTRNPLMFIEKNGGGRKMNDFGNKCHDLHYKGKGIDDIRKFLDSVVLEGNDPMREMRESFFQKVLLPPNSRIVAENMYIEMLELTQNEC